MSVAAAVGRAALDLLLPPTCLGCDAPVARQGQFCTPCFRATGFITEPCCRMCGVPFAHAGQGGADRLCPVCRTRGRPWGRARAALRYDERARRLLLPFKHGDRTDLAGPLAGLMARAGAALLRDAELIVPVPLHRRRLIARRYNQAALLALALSRITLVPAVPDALLRIRATAPLGALSAEQRAGLVEAAFAVRRGRGPGLAGRRILLVDDVMTSGSTCAACARVLLDAGAAGVDVLVAARVPDPRLA
jgi:ComF family protein